MTQGPHVVDPVSDNFTGLTESQRPLTVIAVSYRLILVADDEKQSATLPGFGLPKRTLDYALPLTEEPVDPVVVERLRRPRALSLWDGLILIACHFYISLAS